MQSHVELQIPTTPLTVSRPLLVSASLWLTLLSVLFSITAKIEAQVGLLAPAHQFAVPISTTAAAKVEIATVKISNSGSLGAIRVLTQGTPNRDFVLAAGGSCTPGMGYFVGQVCTVAVSFQPKYPGTRQGAVVLVASDGQVLGTQLLIATGVGALLSVIPAQVASVAGSGRWIYSGDGMPATQAALFLPMGGAADAAGNLYIADSNNQRIRKVDAVTGLISTVAGDGIPGFSGDGGPATNASLTTPSDVKVDGAGNLYIADSGNDVIRRVDGTTGVISTVAGMGASAGYLGDGGPAIKAQLAFPNGVALDGDHLLYISDTANNTIRRVDLSTGLITTLAGNGTAGFGGDGGPATSGMLNTPWGIALAADGTLYVADLMNNRIRKVGSTGLLSTVGGTGQLGFGGDRGPATAALLNVPAGVAVDVAGNIFIADSGNSLVRKIEATTGIISTRSGTQYGYADGDSVGPANRSVYDGPYSLFFDGPGNLYVSDMFHQTVRQVTSAVVLDYPAVRVGKVSLPQPAFVENDGNGPLNVSALQLNEVALDPATTTCTAPQQLAIDESCTMGLEHAPIVVGSWMMGTLSILSDAANQASIQLYGDALSVDPTFITLSASQNPAASGSVIDFTATVVTSGKTSPTGTVSFLDGTLQVGSVVLDATGMAKFSTATLTAGTHEITAVYDGDDQNAKVVSSALAENVEQATTTVLTLSPNPSMAKTLVTFTATVSGPSGTGVAPSGTVTFYDGTAPLGNGSLNTSGVAVLLNATLSAGVHDISAKYAGDTKSLASESAVVVQTVSEMPTSTSLATSSASIFAGENTSLTAVVTRVDGIIPIGVVTFLDGIDSIGAAPLDATGTATWVATGLAAGTHSITAIYAGDANDKTSTSNILTETVRQISTSTMLAASAAPANAGAVLQFTATVSPGGSPTAGAFSGTVTFRDATNGVVLGTPTISAGGIAILSISTLTVGTHNVTASFSGNINYVGSTSAPILETIVSATTSTVMVSSLNPSIAGGLVSFSVTVTGSGGIPTGTVTLMDWTGGAVTSVSTGTLNAQGAVTFTNSSLAVGQHSLTVVYNGDSKDNTSTSSALLQLVQIASTSTSLLSSANPVSFGANVTLTARVFTNGGTSTGTVVFTDGAATLGAVPVIGGNAVFNTSSLRLGAHSIAATYSGDASNAGSASARLSQQVLQAGGVSLMSDANPSIAGTGVTFTTTIAAPQGIAVTGTVTFEDGGTALGMGNVSTAGVGTYITSSLTVGQHLIVAKYSGDPNNQAASSGVLVQTVQTAGTSVTLVSSVNPVLANAPVMLTSTVIGKGGGVTGVVTFQDGTATLGVANVNAGVATFLVAGLSPGIHSIIAVYDGDANNSRSTSQVLSQSVVQTSTVALASSQNPSLALDPVTFTARVSNGSSSPPSGTVVFTDGTATLGTVALDAIGTATFTAASMTTGQHAISAAYSGDLINLAGISPKLTQSVQLRSTTNGLTASSTSLTGGQQVTLISVVHFSGPMMPTGSVTFTSNGQLLGTATLDTTGVATFTVNLLTSTSKVIACYSGDAIYALSTSAQTSIVVAKPMQFTMEMNPSSVALQSQQHSITTLTLTSLNGFSDTIDLGCAGLPFAATCAFANSRIALGANKVLAIQVVVDTGSPLGSGSQARLGQHGGTSLAAMCFLPVGSILGLLLWRNKRHLRGGLGGLLMLLLLAGLSTGLGGCGGLQINGTPPGTYVFQLTATGTGTGVTQAMDMTLTVTQ